jgi:hypothetical protein
MAFFPPLGPGGGSSGRANPKGWDRCVLANQVIPGFVRVTRANTRLKIDHKPKPGADGGNPTFHGLDPQPIELEIMTFSDDDREQLASIVQPLLPKQGTKPTPVSIDHPSLRILGISAVQVVGGSGLIHVAPMKAKMNLELLHWLPTKKQSATSTPKGAPKRKVQNDRKQANTPPEQQTGFCSPPMSVPLSSG